MSSDDLKIRIPRCCHCRRRTLYIAFPDMYDSCVNPNNFCCKKCFKQETLYRSVRRTENETESVNLPIVVIVNEEEEFSKSEINMCLKTDINIAMERSLESVPLAMEESVDNLVPEAIIVEMN